MPATTQSAIDLPFTEAIDYFRQKTRIPSERWTDVWKQAHARGFAVAGATSDALLRDFQGALDKALSKGTTLAEFRQDFDDIVARHGWQHTGTPGWRAEVIYETNLATAYSAGRYVQATEPAMLAAFPYWTYRHSGNRHPRLMHLAWDGLTLPADDRWWDTHYPPNGWHCGCRVQLTTRADLSAMGKSGPDHMPPPVTKTWIDPKTGQAHEVPIGIDPGFDWNPGKAWKQREPATDHLKPPALIPEPEKPKDDAVMRAKLARQLATHGGTGTAEDARLVAEHLQRLPQAALLTLEQRGVSVVACRNDVVDVLPELGNVRPRGYSEGRTWRGVPGLYSPASKRVVVATEASAGGGRALGSNHGSADLVAHECAHAFDPRHADADYPQEFLAARDVDLAQLTQYERQPADAGLSETWAESFARWLARRDAATPALRGFWERYFAAAALNAAGEMEMQAERGPSVAGTTGYAEMAPDGTLRLQLRLQAADGSLGDAYRELRRDEPGYDEWLRHLAGIEPGEGRAIPFWPDA